MGKRSDKPESFLVLWSKERLRELRRVADRQPALRVIFGGPPLSLPSLLAFGVRPGDRIFPVFAAGRRLHLLCGATVRAVLPIRPFLVSEYEYFASSDEGREAGHT